MSAREPIETAAAQPVLHQDFLPSAAPDYPPAPVPWQTLSRAQCLMLAMAWHRAAELNHRDEASVAG